MYSPLIFVVIAVVVASLHMLAPDHWLPLTALSLKRGYKKRRVLYVSAILGFLHGSISVILSLFALFLGVTLFGLNALKEISIIVLIAVAVYLLANTIKETRASENVENTSLLVSILPDPVLLPVIIASYPLGKTELIIISISFVLASILALLVVLAVVMVGIAGRLSRLKGVTVDYVVILALVLTAIYIYFFG
ncbi:MAG: hypothetical protein M0Z77_04230 [Thermoplasmatales archaeon]|nr:hypothetical protein [Candidatus Thermoplasmatota archaeon]MCL6003009.1 hypothetical protein [Candidatus Thermoplasmatota archaeon]MDA8054843.1 hypothetical protein [Thermoplasmatales archaeon]